jgi:hypothetical protein
MGRDFLEPRPESPEGHEGPRESSPWSVKTYENVQKVREHFASYLVEEMTPEQRSAKTEEYIGDNNE